MAVQVPLAAQNKETYLHIQLTSLLLQTSSVMEITESELRTLYIRKRP